MEGKQDWLPGFPVQIYCNRNESVSTHTIEMFCRILDCEVGDIMKYIKDEEM